MDKWRYDKFKKKIIELLDKASIDRKLWEKIRIVLVNYIDSNDKDVDIFYDLLYSLIINCKGELFQ